MIYSSFITKENIQAYLKFMVRNSDAMATIQNFIAYLLPNDKTINDSSVNTIRLTNAENKLFLAYNEYLTFMDIVPTTTSEIDKNYIPAYSKIRKYFIRDYLISINTADYETKAKRDSQINIINNSLTDAEKTMMSSVLTDNTFFKAGTSNTDNYVLPFIIVDNAYAPIEKDATALKAFSDILNSEADTKRETLLNILHKIKAGTIH